MTDKEELKQAVKEALAEKERKPEKTDRLKDLATGVSLIGEAILGTYHKPKKVMKCYNCHEPLDETEDGSDVKRFLCKKCGRDVTFFKSTGALIVHEAGNLKFHVE